MESLWYQNAVFYGMDIRRYQDSNGDGFGDIPGLISRLDYLKDLGVDALWLMPFFDTPFMDNGYDIRDYFQIDQRVGSYDDFFQLMEEARQRELRIVIDLVMNHTSVQHPWFQASRRDMSSRFRSYYIWSQNIPEKSLGGKPVFPGIEESVWAFDPEARMYYYHRFYDFQADLQIGNPDVQNEIFKAVDFWLAMGVDGFRIDAAPLMLEPKGLPGTSMKHPHRLFEDLHDFVVNRKREAVLLGEANLEMQNMDRFFGGGSQMNMLFNFHIGPHIMLAFTARDAHPLKDYLNNVLDPPAFDQWLNFLRHHDELTLDVLPQEQQSKIFREFAPQDDMRIYGRGIRRRLAPMLAPDGVDGDRSKLELAFSFMFSSPGTPLIFYGDEIGMGDDLSLVERNSVRTPMQWNDKKNAGFSSAEGLIAPVINQGPFAYNKVNVSRQEGRDDSLLSWIKQLIAVRKKLPEIGLRHPWVLETEEQEKRVIVHFYPAIEDRVESAPILLAHNFSPEAATVTIPLPEKEIRTTEPEIWLGNGQIQVTDDKRKTIEVKLPEYGFLWVRV